MAQRSLVIAGHKPVQKIHEQYLNCSSPVEKMHWQIIWLLARQDNPLKSDEVSRVVGCSADWVRKLARRYNAKGADGIKDRRKENGNAPILNNKQIEKLEKTLSGAPTDGGLWNCRKVAEWLLEETGREVSVVTGWNYLKTLGYSVQVPRPRHKKAASAEEQAAFKKNSAKMR